MALSPWYVPSLFSPFDGGYGGYVWWLLMPLVAEVPPQPRQIQIRVCLRAHRQPGELRVGPEGVWGVFRGGGAGEEMEGA